MEDINSDSPLFKKVDTAVFDSINKFKQTPNYTGVQDFYNGMEEDQQKVFKGIIVLTMILIPALFLTMLFWQNSRFKEDLALRESIVNTANQILAQSGGLQEVGPRVLSMNPIDSQSMMTSRLSNMLSSMGVDLSKIQVKDFNSNMISSGVMQSEADFSFTNVSTDELMNIFTAMIQREKFRIQDVSIKRNPETNFLQGQFHAIHFSSVVAEEEE
jgi:hypothetical protein